MQLNLNMDISRCPYRIGGEATGAKQISRLGSLVFFVGKFGFVRFVPDA